VRDANGAAVKAERLASVSNGVVDESWIEHTIHIYKGSKAKHWIEGRDKSSIQKNWLLVSTKLQMPPAEPCSLLPNAIKNLPCLPPISTHSSMSHPISQRTVSSTLQRNWLFYLPRPFLPGQPRKPPVLGGVGAGVLSRSSLISPLLPISTPSANRLFGR